MRKNIIIICILLALSVSVMAYQKWQPTSQQYELLFNEMISKAEGIYDEALKNNYASQDFLNDFKNLLEKTRKDMPDKNQQVQKSTQKFDANTMYMELKVFVDELNNDRKTNKDFVKRLTNQMNNINKISNKTFIAEIEGLLKEAKGNQNQASNVKGDAPLGPIDKKYVTKLNDFYFKWLAIIYSSQSNDEIYKQFYQNLQILYTNAVSSQAVFFKILNQIKYILDNYFISL